MKREAISRILAVALGVASPTFLALGVQARDASPFPLTAEPLAKDWVIDQCREPLDVLLRDVRARAELVREAGIHRVSEVELCKLMTSYKEAERKMISFLGTNEKVCAVLPELREKVRTNYMITEKMKEKACTRRWQF